MKLVDIHNKDLGITSTKVRECDSLEILHAWLQGLNAQINLMAVQISSANSKLHAEGVYSDPKWYHRITSAKKLQGILKQQVQGRITELNRIEKKTSKLTRVALERDFWKDQAKKYLHSSELEDCYIELDEILRAKGLIE